MTTKQKQLLESYIEKQVRKQLTEGNNDVYSFKNLGGGLRQVNIDFDFFENNDLKISTGLYSTMNTLKYKPKGQLLNMVTNMHKEDDESLYKKIGKIKKEMESEIESMIQSELEKADNSIGTKLQKIVDKYNK